MAPGIARRVLITVRFDSEWVARWQARWPMLQFEVHPTRHPEKISLEIWREVEILYTFNTLPPPEWVPRLRWVQLHSAGADHLLEHPLFQRDVWFTTASGVHAINMAEYVFAMVLAWFHRVPRMLEWQARAQWPPDRERWSLFVPEELWGKRMGIVGYGSIGRQIARLAKAFGMRVLAMHRGRGDPQDHRDLGFVFPGTGDPEGVLPDRYYPPDQLHALLAESDVVVIAVPLTPETRGMFDEAAFRAMKPSAFLVNIARGPICVESALIRALREGWIAGAALDVFDQEPLPPEHPLWHLPNVLISPHVSGFTPHYDARAAALFEANLERYLKGEPLFNLVDKKRGY